MTGYILEIIAVVAIAGGIVLVAEDLIELRKIKKERIQRLKEEMLYHKKRGD